MKLDEAELGDVVARLRRVEGQIAGVIRMIEAGRDCTEIVTQMAAASRALDRAGFRVIATGMRQCVINEENDAPGAQRTRDELERLFLSLA